MLRCSTRCWRRWRAVSHRRGWRLAWLPGLPGPPASMAAGTCEVHGGVLGTKGVGLDDSFGLGAARRCDSHLRIMWRWWIFHPWRVQSAIGPRGRRFRVPQASRPMPSVELAGGNRFEVDHPEARSLSRRRSHLHRSGRRARHFRSRGREPSYRRADTAQRLLTTESLHLHFASAGIRPTRPWVFFWGGTGGACD